MQKIEAVDSAVEAGRGEGCLGGDWREGMTIIEAGDTGGRRGTRSFYRGREYSVDLLPKVKLEVVVADAMLDKAILAITTAARTGTIGDGKIFCFEDR